MSKEIEELSRRNAETFNIVVREQNNKIEEQQKKIDSLNNSVANLTIKLAEFENILMIQKVKLTGSGPSVK